MQFFFCAHSKLYLHRNLRQEDTLSSKGTFFAKKIHQNKEETSQFTLLFQTMNDKDPECNFSVREQHI